MGSRQVDRVGVRSLQSAGAQVVEVLERAAYERAHLPGAEHVHLPRIGREERERLDASRPVVVYCADGL